MNADQFAGVERLFDAALDVQPEEREAFLEEACGGDGELRHQVERLLRHAARATASVVVLPDVKETISLPEHDIGREEPGTKIGSYTLREQLGEGGFAIVYAAEQTDPVRRQVALKILKLGMDSKQVIARFEAERQALAMMDHPNVAKVFDAGLTETGRPYFVMEYVAGTPITEYCDRSRLSIDERLRLFTQVCHAVQHAHQKAIIHRDIKPSNVLVAVQGGDPLVKVIDFGVAKAISHRLTEKTIYTEQGQLIGTPEYMSPEQAEMTAEHVDTRSDIYSLGVLLYELLTGALPFDPSTLRRAAFGEIQRIIREEEPPKPSTRLSSIGDASTVCAERRRADPRSLLRELRGDLDWITMKALEKDRGRRYETANGLALDIRRHLEHEPVLAGPPSAGYRLRKFVRRNRVGVVAGTVVAVGLLAAAAVSVGFALSEARQRRVADAARDDLEQVAAFQANMLGSVDAALFGVNVLKDLEGRVRGALERRERSQEQIEEAMGELAALLDPVNATDFALAVIDENVLRRAAETIESDFAGQPLIEARLRATLGDTYARLGDYTSAGPHLTKALEIRRRALGDDDPDTLTSIDNMGVVLQAQGRLSEAERYYGEALDGRRRVLGDDHPHTLDSINNMGSLLERQGKLAEAEPYYREALDGSRRVLGDDHPDTLTSINNLGLWLQNQGRFAEAEPYHREAMEGGRRVLGDDHPDTLIWISNMGMLLSTQGRLSEAERFYREAMDGRRRVLGNNHPDTLGSIHNMSVLLQNQGRLVEAERYVREAMEGFRRVFGVDHSRTMVTAVSVGVLLQKQGRLSEAEPYFRGAWVAFRRSLGDDHPNTLAAKSNLALLLVDLGEVEEGEKLARETAQKALETLGAAHWFYGNFLAKHGRALAALERFDEAETALLEAHDILHSALGGEHDQTGRVVVYVADLYEAWGKPGKAAEWRAKLPTQKDAVASDPPTDEKQDE